MLDDLVNKASSQLAKDDSNKKRLKCSWLDSNIKVFRKESEEKLNEERKFNFEIIKTSSSEDDFDDWHFDIGEGAEQTISSVKNITSMAFRSKFYNPDEKISLTSKHACLKQKSIISERKITYEPPLCDYVEYSSYLGHYFWEATENAYKKIFEDDPVSYYQEIKHNSMFD